MKDFVFAEYERACLLPAVADPLRACDDDPPARPFDDRPDTPPPREPLVDRPAPELLELALPELRPPPNEPPLEPPR